MAEEGDTEGLRLAYELQALALAGEALNFGGHPSLDDLERIGRLQELVEQLETSLVTALLDERVTWQRMADARKTPKQALHYRLSRTCINWRRNHVPASVAAARMEPETYLLQQFSSIRELVKTIGRRQADLQAAARGSLQHFLARGLRDEETAGDQ